MVADNLSHTLVICHLSTHRVVRRWLVAAGVKTSALDGRSAHALRRTAGSDVMDACGDIRIVQEMLGHARVETTARAYLRPVPIHRLRSAMEGRHYMAQ